MDSARVSLLHQAAYHGQAEVLKALLVNQKLNPDVRNQHGQTPLMWAARRGHPNICALLLSSGADINATDNSGSTALHHACSMQHAETVRLLIGNHCDVGILDKDGQAAMALANDETLIAFLERVLSVRAEYASAGMSIPPASPIHEARRSSVLSPTKSSSSRKRDQSPSKGLSATKSASNLNVGLKTIEDFSPRKADNKWIPLHQYDACGAREGDLYICVEHCFDCGSHGMSLRHDQSKYLNAANVVVSLLVKTLWSIKKSFPFIKRVFGFRTKPINGSRLGALEVSVAFKARGKRPPKTKAQLLENIASPKYTDIWLTEKIFSKLSSLSWPNAEGCRESFVKFIGDLSAKCTQPELSSPRYDEAAQGERLAIWTERIGMQDGLSFSRLRYAFNSVEVTTAPRGDGDKGFLALLPKGTMVPMDHSFSADDREDGSRRDVYDTNYYTAFEQLDQPVDEE